MSHVRIALANIEYPASPEESVTLATAAIAEASARGADIVCFPECYVPGYRGYGHRVPPADPVFLERAWSAIAEAAARANVAVVLGTERIVDGALRASVLVIDRDGTRLGFQDKVQVDPSEDPTYEPGSARHLFQSGPLTFGVAICHEGWRYPETVRWAARHGAQVVFHPHVHEAEPGSYRPATFGDPANTFHEKAALCRAAENTCFFATVNCASVGSGTTSAIVRPDGTLVAYQPYGQRGLLVADIDLAEATGLLARRYKEPAGDVVGTSVVSDYIPGSVLRLATRGDVAAMRRVRVSVRENRLTSTTISDADCVRAIEQAGRGWVVEVENEIVGFAVGNAETGNMWALFVDPAYQRRGHGRVLHDAVVTWLWSQGLDHLWLTTDPNTRAERFYRAAGWRSTERTEQGELRFELWAANRGGS